MTTDPARIQDGLQKERPEALTVVFCTYQSLPLVEAVQAVSTPAFDLVVCGSAPHDRRGGHGTELEGQPVDLALPPGA